MAEQQEENVEQEMNDVFRTLDELQDFEDEIQHLRDLRDLNRTLKGEQIGLGVNFFSMLKIGGYGTFCLTYIILLI